MSLQSFLSMSGYAAYVWPCYGLTLAVLLWNVWSARRQLREETLLATRRSQAQSTAQHEAQP
jgi:heme exporter protein CcmD